MRQLKAYKSSLICTVYICVYQNTRNHMFKFFFKLLECNFSYMYAESHYFLSFPYPIYIYTVYSFPLSLCSASTGQSRYSTCTFTQIIRITAQVVCRIACNCRRISTCCFGGTKQQASGYVHNDHSNTCLYMDLG